MYKVSITVEGISSILMNSGKSMVITSGPKSPKNPTPEEEVKNKTYYNDENILCIPTIGMRSSIIDASSPYKYGRKSLKTVLPGMILQIEPEEHIPLKREEKYLYTYDEIDIRRAVIQGKGVMRARPRTNLPWEASFHLFVDSNIMPLAMCEQLEEIINRAGMLVGICDYRPSKRGWFGKYKVVSFDVEEI